MTARYRHLQAGEILFSRGEAPDFAYLVEDGTLVVYYMQDGKEVVIDHVMSGDLLGEMAVLDKLPRTANIRAVSDCRLVQIASDQFNERIQHADPILRLLITKLLNRYRVAASTINDCSNGKANQAQVASEHVTFEKIRLEAQLRKALTNNGLDVRYQPLLEISTNTIVGYEALVRWQHPERGCISPVEFIKLAEETSLIKQVGEYVINTACKAVRTLITHGASPHPFIAVNISPVQLQQPDLVERMIAAMKREDLPKGSLKIELTESQFLVADDVKKMIKTCQENGIKVALDDFGTGYSNLTQLHEFQFDTIKIDQAFTRNAEKTPRSMILVNSILQMCHLLGADALVEGVENQEIIDLLKAQGCRYAQGYYIGKPQRLDEIIQPTRSLDFSMNPSPASK